MPKQAEDAMLMQQGLKDSADERNTYIDTALDALSDADKASDKSVLDKTREIIKDTFRVLVGANLAAMIANGLQLKHIKEYKDSIQTTRVTPTSHSSSSSSFSSSSTSGANRLDKGAVINAACKEESGG